MVYVRLDCVPTRTSHDANGQEGGRRRHFGVLWLCLVSWMFPMMFISIHFVHHVRSVHHAHTERVHCDLASYLLNKRPTS
jgi:hypothetical protein